MGSGKRLPATRKALVASYVAEMGEVTVGQIAKKFAVSMDTVRRDLDALDADGTIIRTHGGAVSPVGFPRPDSGLDLRLRVQAEAKECIGRLAAEMVEDNTALLINSGTTVLAMVKHLAGKADLTIATNNLRVPGEINQQVIRDLYVFGGSVRLVSQASVGPVRLRAGTSGEGVHVHADLAFIGVGAINDAGELSTSNLQEAAMMSEMISSAERVVILADSTKLGRQLFARVGHLSEIDALVTEKEPPAEMSALLAECDVEVVFPR